MSAFAFATPCALTQSVKLRASPRRARCAAVPRVRTQLVTRSDATEKVEASKIKTDGSAMIKIVSEVSCKAPCRNVGATPGTNLATYMQQSPEFLTGLDLPLGAKLTRQTDDGFTISLPKIDLFDVWLQPTATATVTSAIGEVCIVSNQADIEGSNHVEDLNLRERYDVYANIKWSAADERTMQCDGTLILNIDMPAPFSMMPKIVTQAASDIAVGTMMNVLTESFTKSFAEDYDTWARSEDVRTERAAKAMKEW